MASRTEMSNSRREIVVLRKNISFGNSRGCRSAGNWERRLTLTRVARVEFCLRSQGGFPALPEIRSSQLSV